MTSRVAGAAGSVIRRLDTLPAVTEALRALLSGDLLQPATDGHGSTGLVPFYPPGKPNLRTQLPGAQLFAYPFITLMPGPLTCASAACSDHAAAADVKCPWLADVITALLLRASEMADGAEPGEGPPLGAAFDALYPLVVGDLQALKVITLLPTEGCVGNAFDRWHATVKQR